MTRNRVALAALAVDLLASALAWSRLPEVVPLHWNLTGDVDRTGSRLQLVLLGPLMIAGLWAILAIAYRIDPRQTARKPDPDAPPAEQGSRLAVEATVIALLAVVHLLLLMRGTNLFADPLRATALALGAMLLVLGNLMGRVRSNFFVGIRTPWTLSSEAVWRRTHRAAARLMFGAGLVSLPLALLLPGRAAMIASFVLLLGSALAPAVGSYFWWRELQGRE